MPAQAETLWTVEVNEEGFNPRHCNIVRGDNVRFQNVSDIDIRVYREGHGGLPPDPDWTLVPGELSEELSFDAGGSYVFHSSLGDFVTVFTPNTGTGVSGCAKEAPTPTPTPTRTATPTATPAPPKPAKCTWNGCAINVGLAADGDYADATPSP